MATAKAPAKAAEKPIRVLAAYPFCDVAVGDTQSLWGITFTHEVVKQKGEDFHILVAEIAADLAQEMFDCGRVTKA